MQQAQGTLPGCRNQRARWAARFFAVDCRAVQFFLEFESIAALRTEVERDLSKGRAWLPGKVDARQGQHCQLVLVHPVSEEWLPLEAVVVLAGEAAGGSGLELADSGEGLSKLLHAFVEQGAERTPVPPAQASSEPSVRSVLAETNSADGLVLELVEVQESETEEDPAHAPPPSSSSASSAPPSQGPTETRGSFAARSPAERVRSLDPRARDRCARRGPLAERVALERAYGAQVWEALLSNPQLTGPEVARIAKNRTVTQPVLNTILAMSGSISKPEVRRALLSNPRLTDAHAERVLRALPFSELRLVPRQAAYPARVRSIAKRLLPK